MNVRSYGSTWVCGNQHVAVRVEITMSDSSNLAMSGDRFSLTQHEQMSMPMAASHAPSSRRGSDDLLEYLKNSLYADVGKKDDLIEVDFDAPYADEAAAVVNAVVNSYISYESEQKRLTSGEVLKVLDKEKQNRENQRLEKQKEML